MYNHYLNNNGQDGEKGMLFNDFNNLAWLCAHPMALEISYKKSLEKKDKQETQSDEDEEENKYEREMFEKMSSRVSLLHWLRIYVDDRKF